MNIWYTMSMETKQEPIIVKSQIDLIETIGWFYTRFLIDVDYICLLMAWNLKL